MKRRDFMKLSAATALGATVAAMAPSALAATELNQTNGDARRAALYLGTPERLRTLRCPFLCFAAACVKFLKIRAGGFANSGGFMLYLN